jgi:hypothetical protein
VTLIADSLILPLCLSPSPGLWQVSGAHGYRAELEPSLASMQRLTDFGGSGVIMVVCDGDADGGMGIPSGLVVSPSAGSLRVQSFSTQVLPPDGCHRLGPWKTVLQTIFLTIPALVASLNRHTSQPPSVCDLMQRLSPPPPALQASRHGKPGGLGDLERRARVRRIVGSFTSGSDGVDCGYVENGGGSTRLVAAVEEEHHGGQRTARKG